MGWLQSLTSGLRRMFGGGHSTSTATPTPVGHSSTQTPRGATVSPVTRSPTTTRAVAPPAGGLESTGVRPAPGTRQETRDQYKQRMSTERAVATIQRINPDQPLNTANPGMSARGHMHAHHGFQTTEAQQADRVVTGRNRIKHRRTRPRVALQAERRDSARRSSRSRHCGAARACSTTISRTGACQLPGTDDRRAGIRGCGYGEVKRAPDHRADEQFRWLRHIAGGPAAAATERRTAARSCRPARRGSIIENFAKRHGHAAVSSRVRGVAYRQWLPRTRSVAERTAQLE